MSKTIMKLDLRKMTRDFLIGEVKSNPTARAYVESVLHILDEVRPKSQRKVGNYQLLVKTYLK